jgi:hypothetical protein
VKASCIILKREMVIIPDLVLERKYFGSQEEGRGLHGFISFSNI